MRLVLNLALLLVIGVLIWLLVAGIREPIAFQAEKTKRKDRVAERLKDIRTSQELYKSIYGDYAGSFDTLIQVLKTDSIPEFKIIGDPDDPENSEFTIDTLYFSAFDSIKSLKINLDSLRYVPYSGKKQFTIETDTMTYQKTMVNVLQVSASYRDFMGRFASKRYAKYDKNYDPDAIIKFGDMNSPNLSGNWE
jgi:hypothetical protein